MTAWQHSGTDRWLWRALAEIIGKPGGQNQTWIVCALKLQPGTVPGPGPPFPNTSRGWGSENVLEWEERGVGPTPGPSTTFQVSLTPVERSLQRGVLGTDQEGVILKAALVEGHGIQQGVTGVSHPRVPGNHHEHDPGEGGPSSTSRRPTSLGPRRGASGSRSPRTGPSQRLQRTALSTGSAMRAVRATWSAIRPFQRGGCSCRTPRTSGAAPSCISSGYPGPSHP